MAISAALHRIYATAPDGQYQVYALSLSHPALLSDIHLTNNPVGFQGALESGSAEFYSLPFVIKFPDKDASGSQAMTIQFSNIEQELIDDIQRISTQPSEPVVCRFRTYILGVGTGGVLTQQLNPAWTMDITSFTVTRDMITAVANRSNMHNKPFPSVLYNSTFYPGLKK